MEPARAAALSMTAPQCSRDQPRDGSIYNLPAERAHKLFREESFADCDPNPRSGRVGGSLPASWPQRCCSRNGRRDRVSWSNWTSRRGDADPAQLRGPGIGRPGVFALTDVRLAGQLIGYIFALANCALFVLYVVFGHRIASGGGTSGIDGLGVAMLIATVGHYRLALPTPRRHCSVRLCLVRQSASACRPRSFPTCAINWRWHVCLALPSR